MQVIKDKKRKKDGIFIREIETYCNIKDGKLSISYRNKFIENLKLFQDCRGLLKITKLYRQRTNLENAYYWGVIVQEYINGAFETQQRYLTKEEAHTELKANCSYEEFYNEDTGSIMKQIKSTRKKTTIEMEEYMQRCREFIKEWFGRKVFLPNEQADLSEELKL